MRLIRRSVLTGAGVPLLGGAALSTAQADVHRARQAQQPSQPDGLHLALDFNEDRRLVGLGGDARVIGATDPKRQGRSRAPDHEVLHVTSAPDQGPGRGNDEAAASVTNDAGISLVDIGDQGLTVSNIATYDESEDDVAFAYDWLVGDEDLVGVGTDHEQAGVGPDEAWLIVQAPGGNASTDMGAMMLDDLMFRDVIAVFRTQYAARDTGVWYMRNVASELTEGSGPPWRGLSVSERRFVDLEESLVDLYGDQLVLGVGIGRGDPMFGPSILDAYYRELQVAGETYQFPRKGGLPRQD